MATMDIILSVLLLLKAWPSSSSAVNSCGEAHDETNRNFGAMAAHILTIQETAKFLESKLNETVEQLSSDRSKECSEVRTNVTCPPQQKITCPECPEIVSITCPEPECPEATIPTCPEVTCPTPTSDMRRSLPNDCSGYRNRGNTKSGIYKIFPKFLQDPIQVFCDMETDGGGWTAFQRRDDYIPRENFQRNWDEYKRGFGDLSKEFWLGNDKLFALTSQTRMDLRIDLADFDGQRRYATYEDVLVRSELESYRITMGKYYGDAGDSMKTYANNSAFSTKDRKNDLNPVKDCAKTFKGGWWFGKMGCHHAYLNGIYHKGKHESHADGVDWYHWKGHNYSLKFSEMKIRPKGFKI